MCGITGILGYRDDPKRIIMDMNNHIYSRGPDAGGCWFDDRWQAAMGHRRLSILDLSEAGSQPMMSHSGRFCLVFNGEIYNCDELRDELAHRGYKIAWRGHSDTEVLLESCELIGITDTLNLCRGMWAFAILDRVAGVVILSRDRIGEKPLYYGVVNGQFVFASTINAIRAIPGFNSLIDEDIVETFLLYGYIPSPYTIYKGVYKLEPGCNLTIKPPYEAWSIDRYYDIASVATDNYNSFEGSEAEATEELERRIRRSLRGQMMADVPLGAFLSGGIDSTLVVSLMQSMSSKPVHTYTIGFTEEQYNEATFACKTAKHLGTNHTEMYVEYKDVIDILGQLPEVFGEPFGDSSAIPTLLVSKMTRQHVTVALSGDAGDELFCGYNTYKDAVSGIAVMQSKLPFIKEPLRSSLGRLLLSSPWKDNNTIRKVGRCMTVRTAEDFRRMVQDDDPRICSIPLRDIRVDTQMSTYPDGMLRSPESNLMLMDMLQYLPDDILTKVDRSAMYYSLETRIPLLDADVIDFAWRLPIEYKMHNGITKKPLRSILYKYVPQDMMDRPKKGFSVPVSRWLREGQMREWAEAVLFDARDKAGTFINTDAVGHMWNKYITDGKWSSLIWNVLMLEQWMLR